MKKLIEKIDRVLLPFQVVRGITKRKKLQGSSTPWFAHYDAGVPREIYIPRITLIDIFNKSADVHSKNDAFIFYGKRYSYSDMQKAVHRFAGGLQNLGIKKGDRIVLILPNTPQFLFVYWAALHLGAIVVPINPLLSGREVKELLKAVTPKIVFVLDQLAEKMAHHLVDCRADYFCITSVGEFMPALNQLVLFAKQKRFDKKTVPSLSKKISFQDLCRHAPVHSFDPVKPEDTAALLFTGGVTGIPKAVQLSHYNLVANVLQTRAWLGDLKDGNDVVLGMLPFFHSYGMTACHHLSIQVGATLVLEPRFSVKRAISLTRKYKVTIFPGVPTMYRAIVDSVNGSSEKLEHIRLCVSGGAPLNSMLKQEFELLTKSTLVEGYGLSEASPMTHCNPIYGEHKNGSIGLPCPNTKARIVHLKTGQVLNAEGIGELEVKGPQVMLTYWQNQEETAKVLSRDGWLATGDIARMDQNGFFYIVDRKKDLILSGGFNVYPSEVELVLSQHSSVRECAVIGVKDEYYGEKIKAFVVTQPGNSVTAESLLEFCRENLANFKVPKQIVFVDELPKNFLGKILRRQLAQ